MGGTNRVCGDTKDSLKVRRGNSKMGLIAGCSGGVRSFLFRRLDGVVPKYSFLNRRNSNGGALSDKCYFVVSPVSNAAGFVGKFRRDTVSINLTGSKRLVVKTILSPSLGGLFCTRGKGNTFLGKGPVRTDGYGLRRDLILFNAYPCRRRLTGGAFGLARRMFCHYLRIHEKNSTTLSVYCITTKGTSLCCRLVLQP